MFNDMNFSDDDKMSPQMFTDMKKMPPPQQHQQLSQMQHNHDVQSSGFTRQDSLAIASSLQERDRFCNMGDFMETELDLDNYLACFSELDVPGDAVDFDDTELQKANILYEEENQQEYVPHHSFDEYPNLRMEFHSDMNPFSDDQELHRKHLDFMNDDDGYQMQCETKPPTRHIPSKSDRKLRNSTQIRDYNRNDEWDDSCSDSSSNGLQVKPTNSKKSSSNKFNKNNERFDFKPQTKARKYQLKPENEKAKPVYQLKRAKNNDAVRKSRNKAKEVQRQKDLEYDQMKKKIIELESLLEGEREARKRDREMIEKLLNQ